MADGELDEQGTQATLVLAEARSAFERQTIDAWAATQSPGRRRHRRWPTRSWIGCRRTPS